MEVGAGWGCREAGIFLLIFSLKVDLSMLVHDPVEAAVLHLEAWGDTGLGAGKNRKLATPLPLQTLVSCHSHKPLMPPERLMALTGLSSSQDCHPGIASWEAFGGIHRAR